MRYQSYFCDFDRKFTRAGVANTLGLLALDDDAPLHNTGEIMHDLLWTRVLREVNRARQPYMVEFVVLLGKELAP